MTTSTQSPGAPLAYQLSNTDGLPEAAQPTANGSTIRTYARALEGMQKEAIICCGRDKPVWRLICDEGHYLNGTDLAPPPLAFFSAGMASIFTSVIDDELSKSNFKHSNLIVEQDAYYAMDGSALRGTMKATADSVVLRISSASDITDKDMADRLSAAISRTVVESLMQTCLTDTFSINRNGAAMSTGDVHPSSAPDPGDPDWIFEHSGASAVQRNEEDIIAKLKSAETVFHAHHGVGAALKEQQRRTLLIRSQVTLREDGLQKIRVQIHRPVGSVFQFLVDESSSGGGGRAPDGLSLVAAGIAFCYMTQLGRYIQIARKNVHHYSVVQDTHFDLASGISFPVDTHVYLQSGEDESTCRKIVDMAEQTCFLHAACRMSNKTKLTVETRRVSE
ncbi:MAG: OsmC family protein [Gammaproteobacteria bacterium]|nr:OsmC family protein [Gammaproteobacteria bacterium]